MKRFLVPTDFSDNAARALEYSIMLANRVGGEIMLFHASGPTLSEQAEGYVLAEAEKQMERWVKTYRPRMTAHATLLSRVVVADPVPAIISQSAADCDLILMGTQGESGIKGFLVGSITFEVLRRSDIPVLAIPRGAEIRPLRRLLLAIDAYSISSKQVLWPLRELARVFRAEVDVLHLVANGQPQPAVPDLLVDAALEGVEHRFHQEKAGDEIWAEIHRIANPDTYDLLCLIRRERHFLERITHHSVTREELSASKLPILILRDEK